MIDRDRLGRRSLYGLAVVLGLVAAGADVACPFGDDTAQFIVLLWIVFAGLLGFVQPTRPWRWAVAVGPWLSLLHLALRACGRPAPIDPDAYSTIFLLFPLGLVICLIGSYAGASLRRALGWGLS